MAPQDKIEKYDERLQCLLEDVFGIEGGAWISDEFTLSDFDSIGDSGCMEKLARDYGIDDAKWSTKLVDIAEQIWG